MDPVSLSRVIIAFLTVLVVASVAQMARAAPPYGFESSTTTLVVHLVGSTKADAERLTHVRRELRDTLKIPRERLRLFIWDLTDPATRAALQGYGIAVLPLRPGRAFVRFVLRSGDSEGYDASSALTAADLLFSLSVFAQDFASHYSGTLLTFPVTGTMNAYREVLVRGDKAFSIPLESGAAVLPKGTPVDAVARLDRRGLQACTPRVAGATVSPSTSRPPAPSPTPDIDASQEISQTYFQAFGRYPTPDELAYWRPLYRKTGAAEMTTILLRWLRSPAGAAERKQVVHRAYAVVMGRLANEGELQFCENAILTNTAMSYSVLVQNLAATRAR